MILGINTCTAFSQVVLVKNDGHTDEIIWGQGNKEAENLLVNIKKILANNSEQFSSIRKIVVISGPGPFTATRVGVSAANAMAWSLKANLYSLNTFQLLQLNAANSDLNSNSVNNNSSNNILIICRASKREVFIDAKGELLRKVKTSNYPLNDTNPVNLTNEEAYNKIKKILNEEKNNKIQIIGDLFKDQIDFFQENGIEIQTDAPNFCKIISKIDFDQLTPVKIAATTFFKDPVITPGKKNLNLIN